MLALLFILFAGMAIGCAISMVVQRNPLYGAISLIGVFISLACLYVTLAAPFIAAVQVIVYAGAIMVLVVFVIMLLNVEDEERQPMRLRSLVPIAIGLAAILFAETAFIIFFVHSSPGTPPTSRPWWTILAVGSPIRPRPTPMARGRPRWRRAWMGRSTERRVAAE